MRLKKLDLYVIKQFIVPFLATFSLLFFIFILQLAWDKAPDFAGKGLSGWVIFKLLMLMGVTLVQLVTPISIMMASIFTFASLGQKYELSAMKASGISLQRIMTPLFLVSVMMSIGLYFFSTNVITATQKKARNLLYNIITTSPSLNFSAGFFIDGIPEYSIRIGEKSGKKGENWENVFIRKQHNPLSDLITIISNKGRLTSLNNEPYLKMELYDGVYFQEPVSNLNIEQLQRQPIRTIRFDTLIQYFNISDIISKNLEGESLKNDYHFDDDSQMIHRMDSVRKEDQVYFNSYEKRSAWDPAKLYRIMDESMASNRNALIDDAIFQIEQEKIYYNTTVLDDINNRRKYFNKMTLFLNRYWAFPLSCIVFFLVGAPLGSIIRKGGMGVSILTGFIVFTIFWVVMSVAETTAKSNELNPVLASWLPNIIFIPIALWMSRLAINEASINNLGIVGVWIQQLITKFTRLTKKDVHERYQ